MNNIYVAFTFAFLCISVGTARRHTYKQDTRGIHLTEDLSILRGIALEFTNMDAVTALAVHLLGKSYGRMHVQTMTSPSAAAENVLDTWCSRKPEEAFGDRLLRVLHKEAVNPQAAGYFKCVLLTKGETKRNIFECIAVRHTCV